MDLRTTCSKCGTDLSVGNMKALPDGKGFVCTSCYAEGGPRLTKSGFADVSSRKEPLREPSSSLNESPFSKKTLGSADSFFDLQEYVCHECGYSFKKNPEFPVKVCPYCGKRDSVYQKVESSSNEYLN